MLRHSLTLITNAFSQSGSSSAEVCLTSLIRQQNIPLRGFIAYSIIHYHIHTALAIGMVKAVKWFAIKQPILKALYGFKIKLGCQMSVSAASATSLCLINSWSSLSLNV